MKTFYTLTMTSVAFMTLSTTAMAHGHWKHIDADTDGKISQAEFLSAHASKFTKMDTNGDNMVTPAEKMAFKAAYKKKSAAKKFAKIDANKDSVVNETEFVEYAVSKHKKSAHDKVKKAKNKYAKKAKTISLADYTSKGKKMFARIDKNKDGLLTKKEILKSAYK